MKEIRIPYSDEQANAFIDMCLYGLSYGMEYGERDYIKAELKKLGFDDYKYIKMDDGNLVHIVQVE